MITKFKLYEKFKEPNIGDYVVAYRPYKDLYDNKNSIVIINNLQYVVDIGKVVDTITTSDKYDIKYWSIIFNAGHFMRSAKNILFTSKNKKEAEEYFDIFKNQIKYNL